ncbi:sensor histidine kinase [Paenibacillus sp. 1011MAR3C5]|uniref:sensor histidine kinase n=1 Tax=Paenibacillus sp. 1011MAR3C5 TaxID=1675787 RepID=UPI000E6D00F1|nr:sensor histidine kinase [Paenibacillus sp. 1011MAR3C5]RJE90960.1 sensor histidine kinase [Paenibacillus sp. 1011MAR3C5]
MNMQKSFRDYMKKVFLKYSIITIALIFTLYILSLYVTFMVVVVKKNNQVNDRIRATVAYEFSRYRNTLDKLVQNEAFQQVTEGRSQLLEVNHILYPFIKSRPFKGNFVLFDKNGNIVTTSLYKGNVEALKSDYLMQSLLRDTDLRDGIERTVDYSLFKEGQSSSYFFAKAIMTDENIQGYLFFFLEDLGRYFQHSADLVAITDRFDQAIYVSDQKLLAHVGKVNKHYLEGNTATIDNNTYYVTSRTIHDQDIHIINMLSINTFKQSVWIGLISFISIGVVMIIVIYLVLPKIMRQSLQSVDSLIHFIQKPSKGMKSQAFEEFQMIQDEFLIKMDQIQSLMQSNVEIAEMKRKMEIKQLEAQFNPHFAFNVLEMLRFEILFDPQNASEIVVSFANLLRYNIHYGSTMVPVETDIKYVEDYLKLQKMRFNRRLDYSIDVDESIRDIKIPKLIIQPLIENSIKHCIEDTAHLDIAISILRKDDYIYLAVKDNGKGIEPDRLALLQQSLERGTNDTEHYGIFHSHRVVQLIYGEQFGMTIDSVHGEGTNVEIKIPLNKGD